MRGDALKPFLLILLFLTFTHAEELQFSSEVASCTGGGATDEHLQPGLITCTNDTGKWGCVSTPLHDSFFRIHHTHVNCVKGKCTLEYKLDFTPLAIFVIGFLATMLAGLFLAVAMYIAVLKMAGRYGCDINSERERCVTLKRPGYGSFGGKLYCLGHFTDSFNSLLEFDVDDDLEDAEMGESDNGKQEENRAELVEREIYLG